MKYEDAGVDIERKAQALRDAGAKIKATYTPEVLWGLGAFGGMFDASNLKAMQRPVLVASTDGVGTKTLLAAQLGHYSGLGFDIVNHCINDLLVQGAMPLFFLDYVASARLQPEVLGEVLTSLAAACQTAGIPLLGGETAEMPGVYHHGGLDLVGTLVGVVDFGRAITGQNTQEGDVVIALPSSGLHTNGYSLARKVFEGWNLAEPRSELGGKSLGEVLLEPHRSYLMEVQTLMASGIPIKAMAHITGGGVVENLPRVLPKGLTAVLERDAMAVPAIFQLIQVAGSIALHEMFRVFNMGLGYMVVVAKQDLESALASLPGATRVGSIAAGNEVRIQ